MWIRNAEKSNVIKGTVGSGGVLKGDLCVLSSNTFVKITDAPSQYTVVGIALETADAAEVALFELISNTPIVTAKYYTGGSKTSLTDADISKVFDIYDAQTIDLDDTTGGTALCVDYDNDLGLIHFIVYPDDRAV
jgi:hypothetical protein